jgi:membrane protein YqaA with SNARE-associated domain
VHTWPFQPLALRRAEAWCFAWGVVESLLFFIVPDVAISLVAVPRLGRALVCSLWAVLGAMVGGSLMYLWASLHPDAAMAALLALPAVYPEMVQGVRASLQQEGLSAMIWGPAKGIPYKIYAEQAGAMGLPYLSFLLLTVPSRIIRFVVTCLGFHYIGKGVKALMGERALPWVWLGFWILNYSFYWGIHLGR